ncbi:MAG: PAS domain-containing protein [Desulfobacula sp.]|nr:PAS domain-containing protein [Desulfobacula sp.]
MPDIEEQADKLLTRELHILKNRIKELEAIGIQREQYYRSVMNCIHDDIMVIDKNYKITDVNKAFLITCGRKTDEIIGQFCYKISHGFDKPCDQHGEECPLLKVFNTGLPHSAWHQHFHSGGWKTWVDIRLSPITDKNGNVISVVKAIRDVSELVKAGKSLKESDARYRRIIAAAAVD